MYPYFHTGAATVSNPEEHQDMATRNVATQRPSFTSDWVAGGRVQKGKPKVKDVRFGAPVPQHEYQISVELVHHTEVSIDLKGIVEPRIGASR